MAKKHADGKVRTRFIRLKNGRVLDAHTYGKKCFVFTPKGPKPDVRDTK